MQTTRGHRAGRQLGILLGLVLWIGQISGVAEAQERVKVATRLVPPFVMQRGEQLEGFSVDLWRTIEQKLGLQSDFQVVGSVRDLLEAVENQNAMVGVAAISITSERETRFDFSYPIFDSGLQIMVRSDGGSGLPTFLGVLLSPALWQFLGVLALLVLIPAHIVWLLERREPEGVAHGKPYWPGILDACWWAAGTLGAQADQMPRSGWGRVIALLMMFTSILFVAYFTAAVTTALTVQQLTGDIKGPEDLPGKNVATTAGSTAASYLQRQGIIATEFPRLEEAIARLEQKQVDAVVFDAPALLYHARNQGRGKVQVVGTLFRQEKYGIVFQRNSDLRKRVNSVLLALQEDGTYQRLYDRWFGERAEK